MASESPAHDFLLPRLSALVDDAVANGFARDVAVAVLIDMVTSPRFDTAAPDPDADQAPHPGWQQAPDSVVVVGETAMSAPHPIGAQDEADFVKPIGWFTPS